MLAPVPRPGREIARADPRRELEKQEEAAYIANMTAAAQHYGPAPGARKLLEAERAAAGKAVEANLYGVWRNERSGHDFCARVGDSSRCFCGCNYSAHAWPKTKKKAPWPSCTNCKCTQFRFVPSRPEEIGEAWLVRRKGFNICTWRAQCRCKHGHDVHAPVGPTRCTQCRCGDYQAGWQCITCDGKHEDHETLWETEAERAAAGRPVGADFAPFADQPELHEAVFGENAKRAPFSRPHCARPEKSVALSSVQSGGLGMTPEEWKRGERVAAEQRPRPRPAPRALPQNARP